MSSLCRLAVLLSGNGSNLQAIIEAIQRQQLTAKIVVVISDQKQAYGLERARLAGIPTAYIPYTRRSLFEEQLLQQLTDHRPDYIILAGFMRLLSQKIVTRYHGRILNIHPSLLPKYPGLHTYERVLAAGDSEHGTTVHFVNEVMDGGPIICQAKVAVQPQDTPETLKQRVQQLEHRLYPLVLTWLTTQRLQLTESGVKLDNHFLPKEGKLVTP